MQESPLRPAAEQRGRVGEPNKWFVNRLQGSQQQCYARPMCRRPLALSLVLAIVAGAAPAALGSIARALDLAELGAHRGGRRGVGRIGLGCTPSQHPHHRGAGGPGELEGRRPLQWAFDPAPTGRDGRRDRDVGAGRRQLRARGARPALPAAAGAGRHGARKAGRALGNRGQPRPQLPPSESLTSLRSRVKLLVRE
jgi:hypothetical protein